MMEEVNFTNRARIRLSEAEYNSNNTADLKFQASLAASNISIAQSLEKIAAVAEAWMKPVVTGTTPTNPSSDWCKVCNTSHAKGSAHRMPLCNNCNTRHSGICNVVVCNQCGFYHAGQYCAITPGENRA